MDSRWVKHQFQLFRIWFWERKKISYVLSASETEEITTQIQALINGYDKNTFVQQSKKRKSAKYLWRKCNDETYEFRHVKNDTLKAMLLLNSKELIYFK